MIIPCLHIHKVFEHNSTGQIDVSKYCMRKLFLAYFFASLLINEEYVELSVRNISSAIRLYS